MLELCPGDKLCHAFLLLPNNIIVGLSLKFSMQAEDFMLFVKVLFIEKKHP